jgi:hypothetical protein
LKIDVVSDSLKDFYLQSDQTGKQEGHCGCHTTDQNGLSTAFWGVTPVKRPLTKPNRINAVRVTATETSKAIRKSLSKIYIARRIKLPAKNTKVQWSERTGERGPFKEFPDPTQNAS